MFLSSVYIWAKSRELWKFQDEPFLTTLFLGHEGTFHSNDNVPLYSSLWMTSGFRFYRNLFQTMSFIASHITYLRLLSLPCLTCKQTCTQIKENVWQKKASSMIQRRNRSSHMSSLSSTFVHPHVSLGFSLTLRPLMWGCIALISFHRDHCCITPPLRNQH